MAKRERIPAHYSDAVRRTVRWLEGAACLQHLAWFSRFRAMIDLWFWGFMRHEENYLAAVKELGDEATREASELVGPLAHEMLTDPKDLLGKVYQAYGANDKKRFAQFFTPDSVARAMAQMSLCAVARSTFEKKTGAVIGEPACGAGVMAIHALEVVREELGAWGTSRTTVVCNDIDELCAKMCALQLVWYGLRSPVGKFVVTVGCGLVPESQRMLAHGGVGIDNRVWRKMRRAWKQGERR